MSLVQLRRLEPAAAAADRYYREALQALPTSNQPRLLQALIGGLRGTDVTAPATLRKIQADPSATPFTIAVAQLYRGWLDLLANRSAAARAELEPAAAHFASDGEWSTELLAETQVRLGTALLDSGDIDLAQTTLDSAAAIYQRRQSGSIADTAELWIGLARVAFLRNDFDRALPLAQRADEFWQARGDQNRWAGEAAYWHGRILVAAGREEAGRRTLLRATQLLERSPFARDRNLLTLL